MFVSNRILFEKLCVSFIFIDLSQHPEQPGTRACWPRHYYIIFEGRKPIIWWTFESCFRILFLKASRPIARSGATLVTSNNLACRQLRIMSGGARHKLTAAGCCCPAGCWPADPACGCRSRPETLAARVTETSSNTRCQGGLEATKGHKWFK